MELRRLGADAGLDSVRLVPKDAGLTSIELVNLFRAWRAVGAENSIRAIVLKAKQEGSSAAELDFVSTEGSSLCVRGFASPTCRAAASVCHDRTYPTR